MLLDQIVAAKREELERTRQLVPLSELEALAAGNQPPLDFASALRGNGVRLIAEVKRASPSKGPLRPDLDAVQLALAYARSGAAAISVLTEERHFQGKLPDLLSISRALQGHGVPLLRKDFIFDAYQVYESRAFGADALLLIVAILSRDLLRELLGLSHDLAMQCLVEVHNESEVETAVSSGANIIGVNNRDLKTFAVDLATTGRLRPLVPSGRIVVSESGIRTRADVTMLGQWGVDAMLVGEALVTAGDVAGAIKELL